MQVRYYEAITLISLRIHLDFLDKKHLNFGQGLEFLKFGQKNPGPNQQDQRKAKEAIRKTRGTWGNIDKKIEDGDPYFLHNNFLSHIFNVHKILKTFSVPLGLAEYLENDMIFLIRFLVPVDMP